MIMVRCPRCNGNGFILMWRREPEGMSYREYIEKEECILCSGAGDIEEIEFIQLTLEGKL